MASDPPHEWQTRETDELFEAILSLRTTEEAARFFRDLCTLGELEAMTHRWQAARLVDQGLPYHEVAKRTGASTTTVTRVAHWLRHGEGGYRLALERLAESPAATG
ncbi:MAG TPA: YerC/YecD family TrpR-related protein [Gaiellaceae bacterium]|nr:YerC/YecD family TrpR-related protein [Gaiellaceae bacterium]